MEIDSIINDKKVVLICDDSKTCLQSMKRALQGRYHIITASSGYEALSFAILYSPDIVLMDVMMYGMDGFEAFRKMKRNVNTADIPVIFVSGLHEKKEDGLALGAVEWIDKPVNMRNLIESIEYHTQYAECA